VNEVSEVSEVTDEHRRAEQFAERFRAVYLTFHRRDGPRGQLQGASRAVLEHLAIAGPLTIGEAAAHGGQAVRTTFQRAPFQNADSDRVLAANWVVPASAAQLAAARQLTA
jgi:hypothetical protein